VDKFISRLSIAKRLRIDFDFHEAQHGIKCPYLILRLYVYRAFRDAEIQEKYAPLYKDDLQAAARLCEGAEGALREIVLQRSEALGCLYLETSITAQLREIVQKLQQEKADLQRRIRDQPNAKGDVWRIRFARTLGYAWLDLTGRKPAWAEGQGLLFVNFVEAAFESVGGPFKGSWSRQCRTAIKRENRLPVGERWDFRRLIREWPIVKARPPVSPDAEVSPPLGASAT